MNRLDCRNLINKEIQALTGGFPTIDDLADSVTLCNALDDMEDLPESELQTVASETAQEMLAEEGFPL